MSSAEKTNKFLLSSMDIILENSPDLMFIKDKNLVYISASKSFAQMVGFSNKSDLIGKTDFDLFGNDLALKYTTDDRALIEREKSIVNCVERLPDTFGKKNYASTSKHLIRNENDEIIGLYGLSRDITAQIGLEKEREIREISQMIFQDVFDADLTENRLTRVEGTVCAKTIGEMKCSTFDGAMQEIAEKFVHKDYAKAFCDFCNIENMFAYFANGVSEFSHLVKIRVNSENFKWIEFKSKLFLSKISNTICATVFLRDVDAEMRDRQRLKVKAETDFLTGLLNRDGVVAQVTKHLDSNAKSACALIFVDLDCFKQINDNYGHKFGDDVLRKIAVRLKNIVGNVDLVGRIGGDEFLIFLKNIKNKQDVENKVESIFNTMIFYQSEDGREVNVTCSMGVAVKMKNESKKLDQLYTEADDAMYQAKGKGKNSWMFSATAFEM